MADEDCAVEGTTPPLGIWDSGAHSRVQADKIDEQGQKLGSQSVRIEQLETLAKDLQNQIQIATAEAQNAEACLKVAVDAAKRAADDKEITRQELLKEMRVHGEARATLMRFENDNATLRGLVDTMRKTIETLQKNGGPS